MAWDSRTIPSPLAAPDGAGVRKPRSGWTYPPSCMTTVSLRTSNALTVSCLVTNGDEGDENGDENGMKKREKNLPKTPAPEAARSPSAPPDESCLPAEGAAAC